MTHRPSPFVLTLILLSMLLYIAAKDFEPRACAGQADKQIPADSLQIFWKENILTIASPTIAGGELKILYLEAYCRAGSTDRKWNQTVIPHKTKLIAADDKGRRIQLRCTLEDGVIVDHDITAAADSVDF